jgi:hypothetical protein
MAGRPCRGVKGCTVGCHLGREGGESWVASACAHLGHPIDGAHDVPGGDKEASTSDVSCARAAGALLQPGGGAAQRCAPPSVNASKARRASPPAQPRLCHGSTITAVLRSPPVKGRERHAAGDDAANHLGGARHLRGPDAVTRWRSAAPVNRKKQRDRVLGHRGG